MISWIWENLLKGIYDKTIGKIIETKIEINKEKELEKIKNPKRYGLLELEKILNEFSGHEHILDKAPEGEGRKIQIKGGKILNLKELDEEVINHLSVQIKNFESKLKKWHKENRILNKCSKELEKAYWDVYNFFEKNRNQLNQEDIIKFFLRRKALLEEIGKELKS